jgi:DNA-directed RNA polymerase specialized sigma24 family protein
MGDLPLSRHFRQDPQGERDYRSLRQKLVRYFAHKHFPDPENLADEVITRVLAKIAEGNTFESLELYCFGVARNLVREELRQRRTLPLPNDDSTDDIADDQTVSRKRPLIPIEDRGRRALEATLFLSWLLKEISEEERELLTEYYSLPNDRDNLAARRKYQRRCSSD